jgi:hypothetical protein
MERVMLDEPTARCLDGTQGAYYLSRGVGSGANKWLFFNEGKAWCLSPELCLARTKAPDGRGGWKARAHILFRHRCIRSRLLDDMHMHVRMRMHMPMHMDMDMHVHMHI